MNLMNAALVWPLQVIGILAGIVMFLIGSWKGFRAADIGGPILLVYSGGFIGAVAAASAVAGAVLGVLSLAYLCFAFILKYRRKRKLMIQ